MAAKASKKKKIKSSLAKSEDGTVQITFTIPYQKIKEAQNEAAKELAENVQIPGFRKGKAPVKKVLESIPQETLTQTALNRLLPKLVADAITEHKIKPIIYPRFELVSAKENEAWQVRAVTCEFPKINLADYQNAIKGAARAKSIWTPGKDDEEKKEPTREEKEQEVIKLLLETVKVKVPKLLIDEEVNSRLANLISRTEKLGLTLESYLAHVGKTPEGIREEYEKQAENALALDLILSKIADEEGIKVKKEEVDEAIKASQADPSVSKKLDTPEQRRVVESVLTKRAALDSVVSLL